jgi:hypothetical protein
MAGGQIVSLDMNRTFTDLEFETCFYDDNSGRLEIVIHDLDRREHQAITVDQNPEEVANRLENAAQAIREGAE